MDDDEDLEIDLGLDDEIKDQNDAADVGQEGANDAEPLDTAKVEPETSTGQTTAARERPGEVQSEGTDSKALVLRDLNAGREGVGKVINIANLSWYTTDAQVEAACASYGPVKNIKFFEDRSNGRSAGVCAVEFESGSAAKACMEGLKGKQIGNDNVTVAWPSPAGPRTKHRAPEGPMGPPGPMQMGQMGPRMSAGPGRPMGVGPMRPMGMGPGPVRPGPMRPMAGAGPGMGGPGPGMAGPMGGPMMGMRPPGPPRPGFG